MQIKKDEVRLKILETATNEFLKKGYENTSMRVIAQKSHTTLGNIYHYYSNKEKLLDTILIPTIENIEAMLEEHIESAGKINLTHENALEYIKKFEDNELMVLLDKKVVILLKLKSSHLLKRKENIIRRVQEHLSWHFQMGHDAHYSEIVLDALIEGVKHVLSEHEDMADAKAELIKFSHLLCTGIIGQKR